jgi:peptidoglycan hydrolase-like protein with peptidoglycan-binding domain
LRIDQYVLQNGHAVFVGYDTVMSDRVLYFHRSGAWIGETSTDRKTPRGASSGSAPLRIGAAGSGVGPVQKHEQVPSSAQIMAAQERLDGLGFSPGDIDGILGPRTSAALRKYQGASGLPVTGHFDAATFRAMGMETLTQ